MLSFLAKITQITENFTPYLSSREGGGAHFPLCGRPWLAIMFKCASKRIFSCLCFINVSNSNKIGNYWKWILYIITSKLILFSILDTSEIVEGGTVEGCAHIYFILGPYRPQKANKIIFSIWNKKSWSKGLRISGNLPLGGGKIVCIFQHPR